jgi:serine protease Do
MRRRLVLAIALALLLAGAEGLLPPAGEAGPRWGWLGVRIRDLSEQEMDEISKRHGIREGFGAVVVEVLKETPAEAAGIKAGDIVVAIRDRPVVDTRTLQRYVGATGVGEPLSITVLRRDSGRRPISVRVGAMPDAVVAERVAAEYGFFVGEADGQPAVGGPRPLGPTPSAVPSVASVLPRSRAAVAGLKPGDVFLEVNGQPVGTVGALRDVLVGVPPDGPLSLVVRRDRERLAVSLERARTP